MTSDSNVHALFKESGDVPDAALVRAAHGGQAWAQEALFRRYAREALARCLRLFPDEDPQALAIDALVHWLRRVERAPDGQAGEPGVILARLAVARLRRRRVLRRLGLRRGDRRSTAEPCEPGSGLVGWYRSLEGLPAEGHVAVVLRHLEGMEPADIAAAVRLPRAAVDRWAEHPGPLSAAPTPGSTTSSAAVERLWSAAAPRILRGPRLASRNRRAVLTLGVATAALALAWRLALERPERMIVATGRVTEGPGQLVLADGTRVELEAAAAVTVLPPQQELTRVVLHSGKVAVSQRRPGRLELLAHGVQVRAADARFTVQGAGPLVTVTLADGSVEITASGTVTRLGPGESWAGTATRAGP